MKTAILGLLTLSLLTPALAQEGDISQILSGNKVPLTVKLKEMNGEWRHVSIVGSSGKGGSGNALSSLMQLAAMGKQAEGKKDDAASAALGMSLLGGLFGGGGGENEAVTYFTQGKTVTMGSETFLVVYHYEKPELNFAQLAADSAKNGGKEPDFAQTAAQGKLGPDSSLSMSLINFRAISTLKDVRPFDMNKEMEEANKESGLLDLFSAAEKEKAEAPKTAPVKPAPKPAAKPKPAPRRR